MSSPTSSSSSWPISIRSLFISVLIPVILGTLLYQLDSFDPASYPTHVLSTDPPIIVPKRNNHMLHGSEKIAVDQLLSPEDVAYDPNSGVIYTGCVDGWVKKLTVNISAADSRVEDWVFTGGRPLGLALGRHGEVIVADADKGHSLLISSSLCGAGLCKTNLYAAGQLKTSNYVIPAGRVEVFASLFRNLIALTLLPSLVIIFNRSKMK